MKIIAIGGGGFTTATNPDLDEFVLSHVDRPSKRVGYVGTASDDDPLRLERFHRTIVPRVSTASVLPSICDGREAAAWVARQDMIYVGGGDTAKMLDRWRWTGFDRLLRDAGRDGVVLAGVSAGAVCWFDGALVRGAAGTMEPIDCLGLAGGSLCAHYGSDAERRASFSQHIAAGVIPPGIGIDDGVAVVFRRSDPPRAWSADVGCWAYAVRRSSIGRVSSVRVEAWV